MYRETSEAPIGEVVQPVVVAVPTELDKFINWMERKNPRESFYWYDCNNCAMAQWWKETSGAPSGVAYSNALWALGHDVATVVHKSCGGWGSLFSTGRSTFGNTLRVLKAYRASL